MGGVITSGGGFSTYYLQQPWQASAIQAYFKTVAGTAKAPVAGYKANGRGYPDISFLGHNYAVAIGGDWYSVSGTSASCPVFAGMVSLINGARISSGKSSVGWLNPTLYYYKSLYVKDIISGRNNCDAGNLAKCCSQGFYATQGWDPATGLGTLNFESFKRLIFSLGGVYKERTTTSSATPTTRQTGRPTSQPVTTNVIPLGSQGTSTPTLISAQTQMTQMTSMTGTPTAKRKIKRSNKQPPSFPLPVIRTPNLANSNPTSLSKKSIQNGIKTQSKRDKKSHMTEILDDHNDVEEELNYLIV